MFRNEATDTRMGSGSASWIEDRTLCDGVSIGYWVTPLSVRSLSKIAHSWTRGYIRVRRNMAQSDTDALWCSDAIEVRTGNFWRSQRNFAMQLCNPIYEFENDHTGILEACLRVMLWVTIRAITACFSRVPAATWLYLES